LGRIAAGDTGLTPGPVVALFAQGFARVYQPVMRLKSDIFVSALVRRAFSAGDYAAVLHKGAPEAGAIFVRQRRRDGSETLYGPAPQSFFEDAQAQGRLFERRLEGGDPAAIEALLERELRFDPDCWIIELEVEEIGELIPVSS
jgi:hypothetical protein